MHIIKETSITISLLRSGRARARLPHGGLSVSCERAATLKSVYSFSVVSPQFSLYIVHFGIKMFTRVYAYKVQKPSMPPAPNSEIGQALPVSVQEQ